MRKLQARCKHDYDVRVRETLAFHKKEHICLDKPPFWNVSDSGIETIAQMLFKKFLSKTTELFYIEIIQKARLLLTKMANQTPNLLIK